MGITKVAQKLGYKITMWAMLGVAALFVILGGVFLLSSGSSDTRPEGIYFSAAGITEGDDGYNMDLVQKQTSVMVTTKPYRTSRWISFSVEQGEDCVSITPGVWPGESAVITLIGDASNAYKFGRTATILVKCGQLQENLNVNICMPSKNEVEFSYSIKDFGSGYTIQNNIIKAENYLQSVYSQINPIRSDYVFSPVLKVYGVEVKNVPMTATPDEGDGDGISLFGLPQGSDDFANGFLNIYIPEEVLVRMPKNSTKVVRFRITAEYFGTHVGYFELKIVKEL